jgi:hypothetical protein
MGHNRHTTPIGLAEELPQAVNVVAVVQLDI